jgi:glyoxylase-like metal-dependent hydrolase (beta-lactamase superfamily II)
MRTLTITLALVLGQTMTSPPAPPTARELAPETYLLPGAILPGRGPDGNTVVLVGPSGLIAIDTGRHPWQSDGILAFARERRQPVVAIVNTHWHLDHSSGNRRVKAAYPDARLYTTRAVDRALAPGGFLARSLDAARAQPVDAGAPAVRQEERDLFFATMDKADTLRPDVAVEKSGPLTLAGRPLIAHIAPNAVTDADLWLYDNATGIAVVGDLVTLPAPFFETACPAQWQAALDEVWATPFRLAVPGHGEPMTRTEFDAYRQAFGHFRACVASDSQAATCAAGWARDASALLDGDAGRREATEDAAYYVDFLRKNGGTSAACLVK